MEEFQLCDGTTLSISSSGEKNAFEVVRNDGKFELNLTNFCGKITVQYSTISSNGASLYSKPPIASRSSLSSATPSWLQSWVDEATENDNNDSDKENHNNADNTKKRSATTNSSPNGKRGKKSTPNIVAKTATAGLILPTVTPNVAGNYAYDWLNTTPNDNQSALEASSKHNPVTPMHAFTENSAKICVERRGHAMFYADNTIYVHGGENSQGRTLGDVLAFRIAPDASTAQGLSSTSAPLSLTRALCDLQKRCWHTSQFLCDSNLLVVFGGECRDDGSSDKVTYLEDCLVFDARIELWYPACVSGKGPGARSGCGSGLLGKHMVVYGGHKDHRYLHNIHVLDTERWHWSSPKCDGPPPAARGGHSFTPIGANRLLVFGGSNGWDYYNDVHVLSSNDRGAGWTWEKVLVKGEAPRPRMRHSAVALAGGRYVLIRGGSAVAEGVDGGEGDGREGETEVFFDDAFILDTLEWTWAAASGAGIDSGYSSLAYSKTYLETEYERDTSCSARSGEGVAPVVLSEGGTYLVYFGGRRGVAGGDNSLYCVKEEIFL